MDAGRGRRRRRLEDDRRAGLGGPLGPRTQRSSHLRELGPERRSLQVPHPGQALHRHAQARRGSAGHGDGRHRCQRHRARDQVHQGLRPARQPGSCQAAHHGDSHAGELQGSEHHRACAPRTRARVVRSGSSTDGQTPDARACGHHRPHQRECARAVTLHSAATRAQSSRCSSTRSACTSSSPSPTPAR